MTLTRAQELFRNIEMNHDRFILECHEAFIWNEIETFVYGPYDYEN